MKLNTIKTILEKAKSGDFIHVRTENSDHGNAHIGRLKEVGDEVLLCVEYHHDSHSGQHREVYIDPARIISIEIAHDKRPA